jgi:hypothetical protein
VLLGATPRMNLLRVQARTGEEGAEGDAPYAAFNLDWTWGEAGFVGVGNALTFDVSGFYLVDPEGRKKHLVLRDTSKQCLCTAGILHSGTELKGVETGQETTRFAKFPATPASVSRLSVAVPHFPALDNVPLSS